METISNYLGTDHTRCDESFAQLEASVSNGKWEDAEAAFRYFNDAMERHFRMEEKVLFTAFEQATGNTAGPTSVMRMEHQHLRSIISSVSDAIGKRDTDEFFAHADTLRIMMHQHNLKEESILYLMVDRVLSARCNAIIGAMNEVGADAVTNHIE